MDLKHQAEKIFFFQKNMLSFVEILKKKSFRKIRISINNKKKTITTSIYIYLTTVIIKKKKFFFNYIICVFFSR